MVFYKCLRCGYETNRKSSFRNHLNRKFTCKPILKEIPIVEIIKHYNLNEDNNLSSKYPQNILKISSKYPQNILIL